MKAEKCFHRSFTKYLFFFFFGLTQKSHLVKKNLPQNWPVSIRLIFYLQFQLLRSFKVNANGPPVVPALDKTFYTERAAERKPQVNIPREPIHPESSHRPPPTQPPRCACRSFFFFFYHCFSVFRKILFCFARERSSSAGTSPRRVNGPHVKAHGKHVADTPGGFPHIDGEGEGVVGVGGVVQGSLVPKLLQSFSGLHCHPETSLTPPVSPLSSPSLPSSTAALSSFCLSFV